MSVLRVNQLSVTKRDRNLFDELSFEVVAGTLLYVRGPNGAGKTSLLRVLAGLVSADSGEVFFAEQNIAKYAEYYHQDLIYFGHKLGISQNLSAVENLSFWCVNHQVRVSKEIIYTTLSDLNLVGLEDIPVGNLSAGQQRRVALARFWLKQNAKLWILDEPFTALDTQGIELLSQHLIAYLQQGGAVIMTSHQALSLAYPTKELVLEYHI